MVRGLPRRGLRPADQIILTSLRLGSWPHEPFCSFNLHQILSPLLVAPIPWLAEAWSPTSRSNYINIFAMVRALTNQSATLIAIDYYKLFKNTTPLYQTIQSLRIPVLFTLLLSRLYFIITVY